MMSSSQICGRIEQIRSNGVSIATLLAIVKAFGLTIVDDDNTATTTCCELALDLLMSTAIYQALGLEKGISNGKQGCKRTAVSSHFSRSSKITRTQRSPS